MNFWLFLGLNLVVFAYVYFKVSKPLHPAADSPLHRLLLTRAGSLKCALIVIDGLRLLAADEKLYLYPLSTLIHKAVVYLISGLVLGAASLLALSSKTTTTRPSIELSCTHRNTFVLFFALSLISIPLLELIQSPAIPSVVSQQIDTLLLSTTALSMVTRSSTLFLLHNIVPGLVIYTVIGAPLSALSLLVAVARLPFIQSKWCLIHHLVHQERSLLVVSITFLASSIALFGLTFILAFLQTPILFLSGSSESDTPWTTGDLSTAIATSANAGVALEIMYTVLLPFILTSNPSSVPYLSHITLPRNVIYLLGSGLKQLAMLHPTSSSYASKLPASAPSDLHSSLDKASGIHQNLLQISEDFLSSHWHQLVYILGFSTVVSLSIEHPMAFIPIQLVSPTSYDTFYTTFDLTKYAFFSRYFTPFVSPSAALPPRDTSAASPSSSLYPPQKTDEESAPGRKSPSPIEDKAVSDPNSFADESYFSYSIARKVRWVPLVAAGLLLVQALTLTRPVVLKPTIVEDEIFAKGVQGGYHPPAYPSSKIKSIVPEASQTVDLVFSYYKEPVDVFKKHIDSVRTSPFVVTRESRVIIYAKGLGFVQPKEPFSIEAEDFDYDEKDLAMVPSLSYDLTEWRYRVERGDDWVRGGRKDAGESGQKSGDDEGSMDGDEGGETPDKHHIRREIPDETHATSSPIPLVPRDDLSKTLTLNNHKKKLLADMKKLARELNLSPGDEIIPLENIAREGGTYLTHIMYGYNASAEYELSSGYGSLGPLFPLGNASSEADSSNETRLAAWRRVTSTQRVFADHTFFMQPHLAWDTLAKPRLDAVRTDSGFANFGPYIMSDCGYDYVRDTGNFPVVKELFNIFTGRLCPPTGQTTAWSGQFAVSRRRILQNSYSKYDYLFRIIHVSARHWIHNIYGPNSSGGPANPAVGHSIERSWPIIFNCWDPRIAQGCTDDVHEAEKCQCLDWRIEL